MIEENKHIRELYYIDHRNDQLKHTGYDYQTHLFKKTLSNVMFNNPKMNEFLSKLQHLTIYMIESTLIVRNLYNYTVSKYYNNHNN